MSILIVGAIANAEAAVLSKVDGSVFVDHGNGYGPSANGALLTPGDRVRTGDGSAEILYENSCAVKIGPNAVLVVLSSPPTCAGSYQDATTDLSSRFVPLAGGLLMGGAVATALSLSRNSSKTVSP